MKNKYNLLEKENDTIKLTKNSEIDELQQRLIQKIEELRDLERDMEKEKEKQKEKFEKLELKIQEIEKSYQREIKLMQNEIHKVKEDDQHRSIMQSFGDGEHLNTYTHRRLNQSGNYNSQK